MIFITNLQSYRQEKSLVQVFASLTLVLQATVLLPTIVSAENVALSSCWWLLSTEFTGFACDHRG